MNWSVDVLMTRGAVAVSRGAGASAVSYSHHSKTSRIPVTKDANIDKQI